MPTTMFVQDTFDRADSALTGSALSTGISGLVWQAHLGTMVIRTNTAASTVSGTSANTIDLKQTSYTISTRIRYGAFMPFRVQDSLNYWALILSAEYGENADVPPIVGYSYNVVVQRYSGGNAVQSFVTPSRSLGYYGGTSQTAMPWVDVVITVTPTGISVRYIDPGQSLNATVLNVTNSTLGTQTMAGVGMFDTRSPGGVDTWSSDVAILTPYVPAIML